MSGFDLAGMAVALGLGGVVGAISAAYLSWARVDASLSTFRMEFDRYFGHRSESDTDPLRRSFDDLKRDLSVLMGALAKLRSVLRIR